MKIYLSLPITGYSLACVKTRALEAKRRVETRGHQCLTPFDVNPDPSVSYPRAMGNDIAALLTCDGILLLSGWETSRGCRLERHAAEVYNKHIFCHITQITANA
ncbi:MAG: DUF4406 domain-containing protein [Bacteroidales bacterium]|nr:DUF4406 domain-containing protein [Bacteroidales bacterium]